MNQKDPPLGGSRGTDALDVVVWFGSASAASAGSAGGERPAGSTSGGLAATTGWPQRILTVGGIQHRTGEDPHSKHTAEARSIVDQYYSLGEGPDALAGGGQLSLRRTDTSPFLQRHTLPGRGASEPTAAWTPGPHVAKLHRHHSERRPMSACSAASSSGSMHHPTTVSSPEAHIAPERTTTMTPSLHTATCRGASYVPLVQDTNNTGAGPSSLFERRRASVAQGMPRDTLSLRLYRAAMAMGQGGDASSLKGGRPPSGKVRPTSRGRARRPSSAASAASSAASTTPSLEEARRSSSGRSTAPKSASDFPSVDKCRDLNCTIALKRAAALLAGGDGGAATALIGVPAGVAATSTPPAVELDEGSVSQRKKPNVQERLADAGKPARPSSAVVNALRATLGQSIMHTIRTTNAQQLLKVKFDMGPNPAEAAKQATSHAQRLAQERLLYKHIPADEAAHMKLRQGLEEMQTEFARTEIDARMDDFKRRVPGSGSKRSVGLGGPPSSSSHKSETFHHGANASANQALTPAALHSLLSQHGDQQFGQRRASKAASHHSSNKLRNTVESDVRAPNPNHRATPNAKAQERMLHIPVQSRITVGGKEFMYSEFFRPLATGGGDSGAK